MTQQHPAILPVYRRSHITMQRGEGMYLFDSDGKRYLDFSAGIAVNALGHNHPSVAKAMAKQAKNLWHCSNLFHSEPLIQFSEKLVNATSFAKSVFCASSGAEAVESAVKFIRRYHDETGNPDRYRIIVAEGGFHGRTLTAISACQNEKVTRGYAPLMDCYDFAAFNDEQALENAITDKTAAIMLEPIQGEGGVRPHSKEYLQKARDLCNKNGLILFFDEVQCGMARPGKLFAYEHYGVSPDLVTIGKGIGNGYPLAACLLHEKFYDTVEQGCHGSTYGSNPLATAVGLSVLNVMMDERFLLNVRKQGEGLMENIASLHQEFPDKLAAVRGVGLMQGIQTHINAYDLADKMLEAGLIVAPAGKAVIRLLPPLIAEGKHVAEFSEKLRGVLQAW